MTKGKIIYLEGVSSSGKTTLTHILQAKLPAPFFWLAVDMFANIVAKRYENNIFEIAPTIITAMSHTIKTFSDLGIDVIVDNVPMGKFMDEFIELLHEYPLIYVNVTCPLEELRRREKTRGDRQIGGAESQLEGLAPQEVYDITVDTHKNTIDECAEKIIGLLDEPSKFKGFKTIWSQHTV